MSTKIRIVVADVQEAPRQELLQLVIGQKDMEVLGVVTDGSRVVAKVSELRPDVVLYDLAVPDGGLRPLEILAAAGSSVRVVVLAMNEDISLLRSVLAVGGLGYVVCRDAHDELLSVIRKMRAGRGYVDVPTGGLQVDPDLAPTSARRREMSGRLDILSKREREVLEAVAYGFTNREIAARIGISVKSIETYRYRLAEKLDFQSRADLVRFALEAGVLVTGRSGLPESGSIARRGRTPRREKVSA